MVFIFRWIRVSLILLHSCVCSVSLKQAVGMPAPWQDYVFSCSRSFNRCKMTAKYCLDVTFLTTRSAVLKLKVIQNLVPHK